MQVIMLTLEEGWESFLKAGEEQAGEQEWEEMCVYKGLYLQAGKGNNEMRFGVVTSWEGS